MTRRVGVLTSGACCVLCGDVELDVEGIRVRFPAFVASLLVGVGESKRWRGTDYYAKFGF
jgi:hypothetical protein